MGDEITQWRAVVGLFGGGKKFNLPAKSAISSMRMRDGKVKVLSSIGIITKLFIVGMTLLIISGSVETNPGPITGVSRNQTRSQSQTRLNFGTGDRGGNPSSFEEPSLGDLMGVLQRVEENMNGIRSEIGEMKVQISECFSAIEDVVRLKSENKQLKERVYRLEDSLKRNNLLLINVPEEKSNEMWADTEVIVRKYLDEVLNMENAQDDEKLPLERTVRLGKKRSDDSKPRLICIQFNRFKHRQEALEKFRDLRKLSHGPADEKAVRVKEDFCEQVRVIRRKLYPYLVKARNTLGQPENTYMRYDSIVVEGRQFTYDFESDSIVPRDGKRLPDWAQLVG